MIHLAAFADEIDPNIDTQIKHCKINGVTHFELRTVNKINVLDFTPELRAEVKAKLKDAGMGVISIGSPIGKVAIDKPWEEHFDKFKIAVDAANFFESPLVRVFSYYPPGGEGKGVFDAAARDQIIERFHKKIDYIKSLNVTMVHENEKGIYGEKLKGCLDLMTTLNSPKLRTAFDFANFVQAKDQPIDNWPALKPYTTHIHIKDAMMADGHVVPAGEGNGDVEPIVVDAYQSGYRGWLTLEPHLKVAGHSHGETGPELFATAVNALKKILSRNNIPIAS